MPEETRMALNTRGADAALRHARHLLLERGDVPAGLVHDMVARSWRRSFDAGLAPVGRLAEVPHLDSFTLARSAEVQSSHEVILARRIRSGARS